MAVTETIQELLHGIDDAQYGRDMRQYIHKGIQKCYEEGSAGETDLTARQAIENLLGNFATVEASSTASRAYAVGENLVYDSVMYKVTTAIAAGGTITPGTNVQSTTVAAACDAAIAGAKAAIETVETAEMVVTADSSYGIHVTFRKVGKVVTMSIYSETDTLVYPVQSFQSATFYGPLVIGKFPSGFEPHEYDSWQIPTIHMITGGTCVNTAQLSYNADDETIIGVQYSSGLWLREDRTPNNETRFNIPLTSVSYIVD